MKKFIKKLYTVVNLSDDNQLIAGYCDSCSNKMIVKDADKCYLISIKEL